MADLQPGRRVLNPGRRPQPKVGTLALLGSERWRVQGWEGAGMGRCRGRGEGSWC